MSVTGDNIKKYREERGLTQKELAGLLGVSPSAVGMYEQGRRKPDAEDLSRIAAALGVPAEALLREGDTDLYKLIEGMRESLTAGDNVMFNGMPLTEEDVEAVFEAMKLGAKIALERERKQNR